MRVREKSDTGFDLGKTDEQVLAVQPVASSLASAAASVAAASDSESPASEPMPPEAVAVAVAVAVLAFPVAAAEGLASWPEGQLVDQGPQRTFPLQTHQQKNRHEQMGRMQHYLGDLMTIGIGRSHEAEPLVIVASSVKKVNFTLDNGDTSVFLNHVLSDESNSSWIMIGNSPDFFRHWNNHDLGREGGVVVCNFRHGFV